MRAVSFLIFGLLSANTTCYGQSEYKYCRPKVLADGWETNDLLPKSIDKTLIYRFLSKIVNEDHKIHSMLMVRNGKIVLEEYFNENTVNTQHDLRSATKSIRSLLVGIAIDKGYIESVNDPVSRYIKYPVPLKNPDERKELITVRHLLTMSTGLDCNDWDRQSQGQEDRVYKKNDWLQYTLDLPMVRDPGDSSLYCSMGTVLAAEVVSQASGMSIDEFAARYLFGPLGINNISWGHTTNGDKVTSSAKRLYMTSRDMAKIGQMVLDKGKWGSNQIVSEEWIAESTTTQTNLANLDYGYLWWNIPFGFAGRGEVTGIVATGNGGQYIMIFPRLDVVVAFTGGAYNSEEDKFPFAIVSKVLLPFMADD